MNETKVHEGPRVAGSRAGTGSHLIGCAFRITPGLPRRFEAHRPGAVGVLHAPPEVSGVREARPLDAATASRSIVVTAHTLTWLLGFTGADAEPAPQVSDRELYATDGIYQYLFSLKDTLCNARTKRLTRKVSFL